MCEFCVLCARLEVGCRIVLLDGVRGEDLLTNLLIAVVSNIVALYTLQAAMIIPDQLTKRLSKVPAFLFIIQRYINK